MPRGGRLELGVVKFDIVCCTNYGLACLRKLSWESVLRVVGLVIRTGVILLMPLHQCTVYTKHVPPLRFSPFLLVILFFFFYLFIFFFCANTLHQCLFFDESSIAVLLDFGLWSAVGIIQVTFAKLELPKILAWATYNQ